MNPSLLKPLQTVCITFYRGCTPHCWWLLWEEAGTASHLGPLSIHIAKWSIGHWAKAFKNIIKMGFSQLLTCFQCAQGANWQSKDFNTNNTYCSYTSESGVPDTLSFLLFTLRGVLKTSHATDLLTFLLVICVFWCHLPIYSLRERKMVVGGGQKDYYYYLLYNYQHSHTCNWTTRVLGDKWVINPQQKPARQRST